jgi:hypothetical protein
MDFAQTGADRIDMKLYDSQAIDRVAVFIRPGPATPANAEGFSGDDGASISLSVIKAEKPRNVSTRAAEAEIVRGIIESLMPLPNKNDYGVYGEFDFIIRQSGQKIAYRNVLPNFCILRKVRDVLRTSVSAFADPLPLQSLFPKLGSARYYSAFHIGEGQQDYVVLAGEVLGLRARLYKEKPV